MIQDKPLLQKGFTLTELLVSLVISLLLVSAIFVFFLSSTRIISNQSATTDMWQRGRTALAIMTQAVESAGFGLPNTSDCPNGIAAYNANQSNSPFLLSAITASVQSSASYDPTSLAGINTYNLTTESGGGSFGNAPAAHIVSIPSMTSEKIFLDNTSLINNNDLFVAEIPGQACFLAQVTNLNSNGKVGIVHNHGLSVYNPQGSFQTLANSVPAFSGVTANSFPGANFIDLGNSHFSIDQFMILDIPPGSNSATPGTPTLYMAQYTSGTTSQPTPAALARGVVDLQILYGLGSNGAIQNWVAPSQYVPSPTQQILAVRVAMLVRSTTFAPDQTSPASFNLLGNTYTVPTQNGPGCENGNCRHYTYHLFDSVIPVRNGIWGS